MKEILANLRKKLDKNGGTEGFSLLELVVAVGVLLVLTATGLLAYNGITNNARQASVQEAASIVYDSAVARYSGVEDGVPEGADDDWNNSANENNQVKTEVRSLGSGRYEVKAWYGDTYEDSKHTAILATPESNSTGGGTGTTPPGETENPGNGEEDLSFLDNPSQLPEGITEVGNCSSETLQNKIKIYMDELNRRGDAYINQFKGHNNETDGIIDVNVTRVWYDATNLMFEDPDCGFIVGQVRTNNFGEDFRIMLITILVADENYQPTNGYYRLGNGIELDDPEVVGQVVDTFEAYGLVGEAI